MTAPYDNEGWEMTAIPLSGSVYIELHDPPEIRKERQKKQSSWAWQTYMGYAFESYSTKIIKEGVEEAVGQDQDRPEGWSGDVNTNVQVCYVSHAPGVAVGKILITSVSGVSEFRSVTFYCGRELIGSVVRSMIGDIPLCLGGEVDCVKGERPLVNTIR